MKQSNAEKNVTYSWIVLVIIVLLLMVVTYLASHYEYNSAEQASSQINKTVSIIEPEELNGAVVEIDAGEAEWMWKASNGILDEFVENQWKNFETAGQARAFDEGYFYFCPTIKKPIQWWIDMSEAEREVRVRLKQCGNDACFQDNFTPSELQFYIDYFQIEEE